MQSLGGFVRAQSLRAVQPPVEAGQGPAFGGPLARNIACMYTLAIPFRFCFFFAAPWMCAKPHGSVFMGVPGSFAVWEKREPALRANLPM